MLDGIRIVEVEGLGPGPFAAMLLADLGADVIVVHRKQAAGVPGMPEKSLLDRGKRSIALNLKQAEDIAVFKQLVNWADGLIEGFRPGVVERLGIGPEQCHALNPKLVYGRMTGWGQDGPLSRTVGHDMNYTALSGALWYASLAGQPPIAPPSLVGDIGGGALYLVIGMLTGLMNATRTGEGTVIDAAIVDGAAHSMSLLMAMKQAGSFSSERGSNLLDGPHWSRTYQTADGGFMSVQSLEPRFYKLFLEKLGLADDADFQQQFSQTLWPELTARLSEIFRRKNRADWVELFAGSDACVVPVLTPEEAMAHPHNAARGNWLEYEGVLQAAPAPRFSTGKTWQPKSPPSRGEHAKEILEELKRNS